MSRKRTDVEVEAGAVKLGRDRFMDNPGSVEMVILRMKFPKKAQRSPISHLSRAAVMGRHVHLHVVKVLQLLIYGRLVSSKRRRGGYTQFK